MSKKLRYIPIAIPLVIMWFVLVMGVINPDFITIMTDFFLALMGGGGWLVALGIVLFLGLGFSFISIPLEKQSLADLRHYRSIAPETGGPFPFVLELEQGLFGGGQWNPLPFPLHHRHPWG
ncbi:hypothetical protein [Eubacterium aggregans]|uniref:hypothetical protein n=1 Tax=Eubacterium aggregans TaxID=81409 RepID=UPI003F3194AE